MECNKDEALRAKEIAEKKFDAKDFAGAKKFALKAQTLYPGLEGISQMVATFDVFIRASNILNGETDWYSMIGVTPSADIETIRKQYRKLALTFHPDKNKSVGAEGAFKLISEAWSLLSDKSKRASYDQRRRSHVFRQKSKPPSQEHTAPPRANAFYDFSKPTVSSGRVNNNTSRASTTPQGSGLYEFGKSAVPRGGVSKSSASGRATFWTVCHKCKMQYEYHREFLNRQLHCQNCKQPFLSTEIPAPDPNSSWNFSQQQKNTNVQSAMSGGFAHGSSAASFQWPSFSQGGGSNATSGGLAHGNSAASFQWPPFSQGGASKVGHAASVVQKTYENDKDSKRKYHAFENSSTEYLSFANKRRSVEEAGLSSMNQNPTGTGVSTSTASLRNRTNKLYGTRDVRELSQIQIRDILIEKAREIVHKKISGEKSDSMSMDATLRDKAGEKAHSNHKGMEHPEVFNQKKSETPIVRQNAIPSNDISAAAANEPDKKTSESLAINVPDSDFYDFDEDRTEKSFEGNQLWAAYDNDDGMPRFYAFVQSVLSRDPFKVRMSWLNPKRNTEPGSMDWVGSGFTQTCGDFRVSRYEVSDSLNNFSHIVRWTKGPGVIHIFPRKGDVWAVYRNWSPDWNENTPEDVIHKYEMVEVLEDYDKEVGVVVTPLVKVAGFKTVFRQHLDHSQTRKIPKKELFRFSHQVPRHLLTAQEASDTLKGCMELDPAATPTDLLDVIADVKEDVKETTYHEENSADDEKRVSENDLKETID